MMHDDPRNAALIDAMVDYACLRIQTPKDTRWGQKPASELAAALAGSINPEGIGGRRALQLFRDVVIPACTPIDDPMALAYVATAPTPAAVMFDLVLSASSIFAGTWEAGAGAIAAENQALAWLAELAGFPPEAGGTFVSGGSAANLSALVTARHAHSARHPRPERYHFAATSDVHASVRAAARVMDVDVTPVPVDDRGRMTAAGLRDAIDAGSVADGLFAVVASAGTTNAGAIDELDGIADVCAERELWLHVDGAYGLAGLCSPTSRPRFAGIERADSFGIDPHKWLFAPYDCAALVYRDPSVAPPAHAQHAEYLDNLDRDEWNPSDYAYHLSRRARGLPLWFSLATYGTDAYRAAVDTTLATASGFARAVAAHPNFDLLLEPELSVVLFRRRGWTLDDYRAWSEKRAKDGTVLIVPTKWQGEPCMRICVVNPRTELAAVVALLDDMA
jgi:glutamate/tyrosine decarboxylase-like PLP-dependent enzyme